jgi:hypothetical protein
MLDCSLYACHVASHESHEKLYELVCVFTSQTTTEADLHSLASSKRSCDST